MPPMLNGVILFQMTTGMQEHVYSGPSMQKHGDLTPSAKSCLPTSYNWGRRALGCFRRYIPDPLKE